MKKKLLLSILCLFIIFVGIVRLNAAMTTYPPLFSVGNDESPKAPSVVPNDNAEVYATITDGFDFSKVKFKTANGGTINGNSELSKIIIGTLKKNLIATKYNEAAHEDLDDLLEDWFTAYCLEVDKKYPTLGLFNSGGFVDNDEGNAAGYSQAVVHNANGTYGGLSPDAYENALQAAIVLAMFGNDSNFATIFNDLKTEFDNIDLIDIVSDPDFGVLIDTRDTNVGSLQDYFKYLMGDSDTEVPIGLGYVGFSETFGDKKVFYIANDSYKDDIKSTFGNDVIFKYITGSALTNNLYPLSVTKLKDLAFSRYYAKDTQAITNYNHALWIVENSFPSFSVSDSLSMAGVNMTNLDTQIRALYGSAVTDSNIGKYRENLVYGIVQYAIWQVVGTKVGDETLGNSLAITGTEDNCSGNLCELNKLYTYLIKDRTEYNGYSDPQIYSKKITVTYPQSGKEIHETDNEYLYYGPFSAKYSAIVPQGEKINIKLSNANSQGVTLVDTNKVELTKETVSNNTIYKADKGQAFYVKVKKNANIATITADLSLQNVKIYTTPGTDPTEPSNNRGRVYYPTVGIGQNALSGGKVSTTSLTGNLRIDANPKTGVQNIALLLMVTLVAFTLGYLVLSYKQKPIELNQ